MSTEHMEELNDQQIVRREKWLRSVNKELIHSVNRLNVLLTLKN